VAFFPKKKENTGEYCAGDTISPARELSNQKITIKYHSPCVKGRLVWGGLIAYNQVWVTGAHYATNITFLEDVIVNGKTIKAGKYTFFTIPNKKNWTLIINKNWEQHLADQYDEKDDVLRLVVKPERLKTEVSRLAYYLKPVNDKQTEVSMAWEKIKVRFVVERVKQNFAQTTQNYVT